MNELPDWIGDPSLRPAWERIRNRFEGTGLHAHGRVTIPTPTRSERHALGALLGRTVTQDSVHVDLAQLDARLRERSGLGGLAAVLTAVLGRQPSDRVASRAAAHEARERPLELAAELVDTPWTSDWIAGLRRTGLLTGRPDAERVVQDAAAVVGELTAGALVSRSRVELGARLLGDAHALDRDRLLHHVVLRALAAASGRALPDGTREREDLWAAFGVEPDLLSRTCLVWGLRPPAGGHLAARLTDAADAGDPVHVTEWDLRRLGPLGTLHSIDVLVCENPRVVEAAAERRVAGWALVCTSGEPNLVVDGLLSRLVDAGARLRYHGDFDWSGIAIANRVVARFGARPWHMSADDYSAAVRGDGPALVGTPVTPDWDSELGAAMGHHARAVHEESVLPLLLDTLNRGTA